MVKFYGIVNCNIAKHPLYSITPVRGFLLNQGSQKKMGSNRLRQRHLDDSIK